VPVVLCLIFAENQYVIHIDNHEYIQEIAEDLIHHPHKRGRSISESKRHNREFKKSIHSGQGRGPTKRFILDTPPSAAFEGSFSSCWRARHVSRIKAGFAARIRSRWRRAVETPARRLCGAKKPETSDEIRPKDVKHARTISRQPRHGQLSASSTIDRCS
jgi:hypothetical protein